jgi:hypothetical protein
MEPEQSCTCEVCRGELRRKLDAAEHQIAVLERERELDREQRAAFTEKATRLRELLGDAWWLEAAHLLDDLGRYDDIPF